MTPSLGVRLRTRIARVIAAARGHLAIVTLRLLRAQYVGRQNTLRLYRPPLPRRLRRLAVYGRRSGFGLVAPVPQKCVLASVIGSRWGTNIGSVELTT